MTQRRPRAARQSPLLTNQQQGRRRLLQVDSSFTATADGTLNVFPATSSDLIVNMGFRGASTLALLVLRSLFL